MSLTQTYALALGASLLLALASGEAVTRRASWLVGLGWVFSRLMERALGFDHAPYVIPSFDAALACGIGYIGYRSRSTLCFVLVLLYLAQETIAAVAIPAQRQGELWYYSLNGGIFALKLLAIGGWSSAVLVDRWRRGGLGVLAGGSSRREEHG
jgi:hypothetical protein